MEENGGSDGGSNAHWWWAFAGAGQLGWGIASFRRGFVGDSSTMPLKAFAVASLFVGAAASSAIASLKASGIHKGCIGTGGRRDGSRGQNQKWIGDSFKGTR
ncbi:uncharacterized protein LOC103483131 isoform X1 [Cucumis melo]|uniref:Uncharacterized protein LOC103483131 isoform X1 n=1 Tax=Cucumis melo TaxID=3656 RepID=A0ABM3KVG8_CUCME|nr:uncharacterized protein LOC103483131 isoform X1 [Cucumis melo]